MRTIFLILALPLLAGSLRANEISVRQIQSGSPTGAMTAHDHGIHGEGQIVAVLDTGLDWDSCYFAEPDGSPPPINTGSPVGGYDSSQVDHSRRKVIAYDFLYSCAQFPAAPGCENPADPKACDNQGHGTHAAAAIAADKGTPLVHDYADSIAPGAKLVIQDAGFIGGDLCSGRPGLGCPVIDLHPVLQQAWDQGARIHSNEWGDRQGVATSPPPTGNYTRAAQDIDDFVWVHPEMVVVFNTGNAGNPGGIISPTTLSAPGLAKNTISVGGVQWSGGPQTDFLAEYSGRGPTRDGRLKPDLVGPSTVVAGDSDFDVRTGNCNTSSQRGTSWASPTIAGAAALVRQYYSDGFYPSGARDLTHSFPPSAALVKATLIASARRVLYDDRGQRITDPVPNYEQGFGVPVLDDALYFNGDKRKLLAVDISREVGLATGDVFERRIDVADGEPLAVVLVWTDPAGVPRSVSDTTPELVNDLDLIVTDPAGRVFLGNERLHPGSSDRLNNVEGVRIETPVSGRYTVRVTAHDVTEGPRQGFALVVAGSLRPVVRRRAIQR